MSGLGKKSVKKKVAFPCGNCSATTSGSACIQCNICDLWHHSKCIQGMTEEFYKTLLPMKEVLGYAHWICTKCNNVSKKLVQQVTAADKRLDKVETEAKVTKTIADNNKTEIALLKDRLLKVETSNAKESDGTKSAILSEIQEIEDRKCNAVLYGLSESDSPDAETRKNYDLNHLKAVSYTHLTLPTKRIV